MPLINKLIRVTENATVQYGEVTRSINNTSFSDTVRLEIHVDQPKRLYTSGDIISGEVVLHLKREVDIAEILLKYKIDEATEIVQFVQDRKHKNKQNKETFKSAERVYEKSVRLFPLEADLGQLKMQKLTLPPGNHKYPFSVRIPGHNNDGYKILPPSFVDQEHKGSVCHTLKATLKRSSSFKQNTRAERPLQFMPRAVPSILHQSHWVHFEGSLESGGVFNRSGTLVKLAVSVPKVIQAGEPMPLQVFGETVGGGEFAIIDARIDLVKQASISAHDRHEQHLDRQIITQRSIGVKGTQLNVTDHIGQPRFPMECIPSFRTRYIALRYRLEFNFRVSSGPNTKISNFQFHADIDVVCPSPFVFGNEQQVNQTVGQGRDDSKHHLSSPTPSQYLPEKVSSGHQYLHAGHSPTYSNSQGSVSSHQSQNQYPPEKVSPGQPHHSTQPPSFASQLGPGSPASNQYPPEKQGMSRPPTFAGQSTTTGHSSQQGYASSPVYNNHGSVQPVSPGVHTNTTGNSNLASNNPFSPQNTGTYSPSVPAHNSEGRENHDADEAPPAYTN